MAEALGNAAGEMGETALYLDQQSYSGRLLLFGGPGHDTFLGCLSCSEYSSDSIFNEYGTYGSAYSSTSIHNSFSRFGSSFSQYSACNEYASDPPVIVDDQGNYYGRLTLSSYADQVKSARLIRWLRSVCGT